MRLIDADKLDMSVKVDGDRTLSPISQLIAQTIIENAQTIESDEDCISRKAVLNTLDSMDKALTKDRTVEEYKEVLKECYKVLPSIQPTAKENLVVEDCMKREFIEIVVEYPPADLCTYPEYKGKPYYSILYRDEDSRNHVGFGTYKIEMLSQWIKEYFMPSIQPKTGRWISDKYGQHCDQCGNGINTPYKFCPFCGADMREYTSEIPTGSEKE